MIDIRKYKKNDEKGFFKLDRNESTHIIEELFQIIYEI